MKWVSDATGRFEWRPYYDQAELDRECEQLVTGFLKAKNGASHFPISTNDLSVMIEQATSDLDLYADLFPEGEDVEGVTDFFPHKKPAVKIARELSLESTRYNRLRTTLAHEYGHVKFHAFLWDLVQGERPTLKPPKRPVLGYKKIFQARQTAARKPGRQPSQDGSGPVFFHSAKTGSCFRCKRGRMLEAPLSDWMEWQASYAGGAILMPLSLVEGQVRKILPEKDGLGWVPGGRDKAQELIAGIAAGFDVSAEAARVRLLKLGFLQSVP